MITILSSLVGKAFGGFTKYLIFAAILAILAAGFYWYYNDTQKRLAANADVIAKQEVALTIQKSTLAEIKKMENIRINVMRDLYKDLEKAREQISEFEKEAESAVVDPETGQPFDLNKALEKDLGATEDFINKKHNDDMKCIELYSGVAVEKLEKTKNEQDFLLRYCGIDGDRP